MVYSQAVYGRMAARTVPQSDICRSSVTRVRGAEMNNITSYHNKTGQGELKLRTIIFVTAKGGIR